MRLGTGLAHPNGAALSAYSKPAEFNWDYTSEFSIKRRGRKYVTDFDASIYASPAGSTYYVDPVSGSDSNDGLGMGTAFATIEKALTATGASVIMLKSGFYTWQDAGWLNGQPTIARDIALKVYGGARAVIHAGNAFYSWSLSSGQTNTYQTGYNAVGSVIDLTNTDEYGYPVPLTKRTSIAEVESNPGSYYYPTSAPFNLYVHTHDSRAADSNIIGFQIKDNFDIRAAHNVYAENIDFWGGRYPMVFQNVDGDGAHLVFKSCSFCYGSTFEGVRLRDITRGTFLRCTSAYNIGDGFAYRQNVFTTQTDILEVDCRAYNNIDLAGTANNINGSSAHDGVRVIRLGGMYRNNAGGQITDTHAGTQTLNLGCSAGESIAATQSGADDTGYRVTSGAALWMENAKATGSYYDRVNSSSTITSTRSFTGTGPAGDSGTIS